MTIANVSQGSGYGLPQTLKTAQDAIHLPAVQEMMRKLSEYQLGVFMPHAHDEKTGEFRPLPDGVMQVESGLEVSFRASDEIANQADHFLPVGWCWRAGASSPTAVCEMIWEERADVSERKVKHKMPKRK
jgi:hypothetical protein